MYRVSDTVRSTDGREGAYLAITQDGAVVVDFAKDRLFKLNAVAAQMWVLLNTGMSETQVAERIAHDYSVDQTRVDRDLRNLIGRISEFGLSPQSASISARREPKARESSCPVDGSHDSNLSSATLTNATFWKALLGLLLFDTALYLFSLRALCAVVTRWPVRTHSSWSRSQVIPLVLGAVDKACVWYPKKALCLQRSAVMTCLLREFGMLANMIVGVRPMPLLAHAWVEVDQVVIGDFPRVQRFYQSLKSY